MRLVLRVARSGIAFDPLPKHSMAGWLRALDFRSLRAYAGLLAVALWVAPSMAQELSPLEEVAQVSAGTIHACALTTAGGVKCWGNNSYGQLGDGTTMNRLLPVDVAGLYSGVVEISAGEFHTCALLTTGGVTCWGYNGYGQLGDGSLSFSRLIPGDVTGLTSNVSALSTGSYHNCAVVGGAAKCWGSNQRGQLGDGTTTNRRTPVDVIGLSDVSKISAGRGFLDSHTCALTLAGGVKCWGLNNEGQLGVGTNVGSLTPVFAPVDVSGLASGVAAIGAGAAHSCALIAATGGVKCWGSNRSAQIGDSSFAGPKTTPVDVSSLTSGVSAISVGGSHSCARFSSGGIKCWGFNGSGQIGSATLSMGSTSSIASDVTGLASGVDSVSAGAGSTTCAVGEDGRVKCWGDNQYGQLGDGSIASHAVPVDVSGLTVAVDSIDTGGLHTCAVSVPGGATCWGNNVFGQLGDGSRALRRAPVSVSGLDSGVVAVSTGANHSCALTIGGGVKCWGANFQNQLGNGTTSQSLVPIDVSGLTAGVQAIDIGISHTCALTTGGGVKCWGLNSSGQLGDGSSTNRAVPTDVSGLTSGVVAISAGDRHTCALTMAGGVKCWGNNQYGQLGDGTTTASLVPVDVPSLTSGVAAISAGAGQGHTCALTLGGSVKCWGYNGYGNLGDGSYTNRSTPVDVSGLTGIAAISAGYYLTCAVTTDGAMKCWGNNNYGKLGNGGLAISNQPTPADVPGFGGAVAAISAGREHTCAVTTSGVAKCWGWAQFGQLGIDDRNYGLPDHVLGLGPAIFQSGFELGQ